VHNRLDVLRRRTQDRVEAEFQPYTIEVDLDIRLSNGIRSQHDRKQRKQEPATTRHDQREKNSHGWTRIDTKKRPSDG